MLVAAAAVWQYFKAAEATRLAKEASVQAQANAEQAKASAEQAKSNLREAQIAEEAADKAKKDALAIATVLCKRRTQPIRHSWKPRLTPSRRRGWDPAAPESLYMRRFVLGWKMLGLERSLGSRLITYADDLVILCRRGKAEKALESLREIMGVDFQMIYVAPR